MIRMCFEGSSIQQAALGTVAGHIELGAVHYGIVHSTPDLSGQACCSVINDAARKQHTCGHLSTQHTKAALLTRFDKPMLSLYLIYPSKVQISSLNTPNSTLKGHISIFWQVTALYLLFWEGLFTKLLCNELNISTKHVCSHIPHRITDNTLLLKNVPCIFLRRFCVSVSRSFALWWLFSALARDFCESSDCFLTWT